MRPLTLDLPHLEQALLSQDAGEQYLDLATGSVLRVAPGAPAPGSEEKYDVQPDRYLAMMPDLLPYHLELVLFTGLCELAGAIGLLLPRWRRWAALALALYFVCVFPANIKNALDGLDVEGLPAATWYYWLRLPMQPLIILWALYAGELIGRRHMATEAGERHCKAG